MAGLSMFQHVFHLFLRTEITLVISIQVLARRLHGSCVVHSRQDVTFRVWTAFRPGEISHHHSQANGLMACSLHETTESREVGLLLSNSFEHSHTQLERSLRI